MKASAKGEELACYIFWDLGLESVCVCAWMRVLGGGDFIFSTLICLCTDKSVKLEMTVMEEIWGEPGKRSSDGRHWQWEQVREKRRMYKNRNITRGGNVKHLLGSFSLCAPLGTPGPPLWGPQPSSHSAPVSLNTLSSVKLMGFRWAGTFLDRPKGSNMLHKCNLQCISMSIKLNCVIVAAEEDAQKHKNNLRCDRGRNERIPD